MRDALSCRQAFDRLEEYLDRELTPEETARVRAHLEVCEQCTREFHFEGQVLEGVREKLRRIRVPGGLTERVLAALRSAS